MTREEIENSMTLKDAIEVFKSTNAYGTMDIAKSVILKALEQERSRSAEITQYRHDCEKLMEENERLKKALEQEPKSEWLRELKAYKKQDSDAISRIGMRHILNHETKWINERLLQQEPVLDKIRADIEQLDYNLEGVDYDHNGMAMTEEVHMICREEVLQIIDKYKAESEKNTNDSRWKEYYESKFMKKV